MGVIHPFGGLMPPSNFYDVALQQQQQRLQMNQQQRPASVSAPSDNFSASRSTTAPSSSASGNSTLRLHDTSPPSSALHSELVKAAKRQPPAPANPAPGLLDTEHRRVREERERENTIAAVQIYYPVKLIHVPVTIPGQPCCGEHTMDIVGLRRPNCRHYLLPPPLSAPHPAARMLHKVCINYHHILPQRGRLRARTHLVHPRATPPIVF
ncbi:unnamed protein product [Schistocephalus solidus]|uniref:Uncharacterized protein n=1 Tax=Schistocephalus solidus TaxID=70667 RepID=A0A183TL28_SCHSO|nr:unnamed protein product [Schistocephalus solidus]